MNHLDLEREATRLALDGYGAEDIWVKLRYAPRLALLSTTLRA